MAPVFQTVLPIFRRIESALWHNPAQRKRPRFESPRKPRKQILLRSTFLKNKNPNEREPVLSDFSLGRIQYVAPLCRTAYFVAIGWLLNEPSRILEKRPRADIGIPSMSNICGPKPYKWSAPPFGNTLQRRTSGPKHTRSQRDLQMRTESEP